jgi:hypothetical protein
MIDRHLTTSENESGSSQRAPTLTNSMATPADREQAKYSGNGGKRPTYQDAKTQRMPTAYGQSNNQGQQGGEFELAVRRMRTPTNTDAGRGGAQPEEQRIANGHSVRLTDQLCQRAPTPNVPNGGRKPPDDMTIKGGHTPTGYDAKGKKCQVDLNWFVKRAPTPRSEDSQCSGGHRGTPDTLTAFTRLPTARAGKATSESEETWMLRHEAGKVSMRPLAMAVKQLPQRLPTACANEDAAGTPNGKMQRMLGNCTEIRHSDPAGGQLNPTWEDWFMGWPIGWTDARHSATDRFRQWCDSHGE